MFSIDPQWYEEYWFGKRPGWRRRDFGGSVARFALAAALLGGGAALFEHFSGKDPWQGYQVWERE